MKVWKIVLGFAISAGCLFFILHEVRFKELWHVLKSVELPYLVLASIIYLASFLPRSIRWKLLLAPEKKIGINSLFSVLLIGFMINGILLARAGDLFRAYIIAKKEKIGGGLALGTIVVERLFDFATLLIFLFSAVFLFSFPLWVKKASALAFLSILAAVGLLLFCVYKKTKILKFAKNISFLPSVLLERIVRLLESFISGIQISCTRRYVLQIILSSISVWLVEGLVYYYALRSFGINLPLYSIMFLLAIVNFGIAIPSSPGNLGVFELCLVEGMLLFAINKEVSISFAITLHMLMIMVAVFGGLICSWKEGISLYKVKQQMNISKRVTDLASK